MAAGVRQKITVGEQCGGAREVSHSAKSGVFPPREISWMATLSRRNTTRSTAVRPRAHYRASARRRPPARVSDSCHVGAQARAYLQLANHSACSRESLSSRRFYGPSGAKSPRPMELTTGRGHTACLGVPLYVHPCQNHPYYSAGIGSRPTQRPFFLNVF